MPRKNPALTLPASPEGTKRISRKVSLTEEVLDAIRATGQRFRLTDTAVRGLSVDVGETGSISWQVRAPAKEGMRQVWVPIGPYPGIPPKKAREEAERIRTNITGEVDTRKAIRRARKTGTLELLVELWFAEYVVPNLKEGTNKSYREKMDLYIQPKFGKRHLREIDPESIALWHRELTAKGIACLPGRSDEKQHPAATAADTALATFSAFFHWAVKTQKATYNPALGCPKNGPHEIHRPMNGDGRKKVGRGILHLTRNQEANPIYLGGIQLALVTGIRRDSIAKIEWADIDFDNQTLTLDDKMSRTKGTKTHALGPAAISILKWLPRIEGSPYVFPGRDLKEPVSVSTLNRIWKLVREQAGVHASKPEKDRYGNRIEKPVIRFHDLRHSKGAVLGGKNKTPMVAAAMDLATDKMAYRYGHPVDEAVAKANTEAERQMAGDLGIPCSLRWAKKGRVPNTSAPEPTQIVIQINSWPVRKPRPQKVEAPKVPKPRPTKIQWPSDEALQKLVLESPLTTVAQGLGVSDKAVEKRCKKLGLELGQWGRRKTIKSD